MKNCFCNLCEDSREVVIEVSIDKMFGLTERKVIVPCPGCAMSIEYNIKQSLRSGCPRHGRSVCRVCVNQPYGVCDDDA